MTRPKCDHGIASDFKGVDGLWKCSSCGRRSAWSEAHGYHGTLECRHCWLAEIDFVWCSPECAAKLGVPQEKPRERKPRTPRVDAEAVRASRARAGKMKAASELSADDLRMLLAAKEKP